MAIVSSTLARIKSDPLVFLGGRERVKDVFLNAGHVWRERILDPMTTLNLFIIQILHRNTAITHLRHLFGINMAASSYCEARKRLPVAALASMVQSVCVDCSKTRKRENQKTGQV